MADKISTIALGVSAAWFFAWHGRAVLRGDAGKLQFLIKPGLPLRQRKPAAGWEWLIAAFSTATFQG